MTKPNDSFDLMRLTNAFQLSQAIHVAATLGIADLLTDGPLVIDDLAVKTKTDAGALYRLLRALAAVGVFHEEGGKRFSLSRRGSGLRADAPMPVAPWAVLIGRPKYWEAWGSLLHSVRTGENAFRHVHGTSLWEYRELNPAEGQLFDAAMNGLSQQVSKAVVDAYDFSSFERVVDVGGGRGTILAAILVANPNLHGVLFDQPHVVASAEVALQDAGVADRCDVRAGSFFTRVPEGGDAYLLKAILHDWNDLDATQILRSCRAAILPLGKLLLIEHLIAPPNEGMVGKLSDINMLVLHGGRERTMDEFSELLALGGFRLNAVFPTASAVSIIEGVPI